MKAHALALLLLTTGCAGLAWQPNDTAGTKAWKTAVRVPLGIATLSYSELFIAADVNDKANARAAYQRAVYIDRLQSDALRYRRMAENAETPEEAEVAIGLYNATLNELALATSQPARTCVPIRVGRVATVRCD